MGTPWSRVYVIISAKHSRRKRFDMSLVPPGWQCVLRAVQTEHNQHCETESHSTGAFEPSPMRKEGTIRMEEQQSDSQA